MKRFFATALALSAVLALAPPAAADGNEVRGYVTSAGVNVVGIGAAGNNALMGPGAFVAPHPHTTVRVAVVDDSGTAPWVSVCVDRNNNGLCSSSDGDIQFSGFGTVTGTTTPFSRVIVFVYAVTVAADGDLHFGTTGIATVTWI